MVKGAMGVTEKIDICVLRPDEAPEIMTIDNTLKAMQEGVGGYIQVVNPWGGDVVIVCNEEGKLMNLPANRIVFDGTERIYDVIVGTFFLAFSPRGSENFMSLPRFFADRMQKYMMPASCNVEGGVE